MEKKKLTIDEELELMNCPKCRRTEQLHGTRCKKHKVADTDINQSNDMVDGNGDMIDMDLINGGD